MRLGAAGLLEAVKGSFIKTLGDEHSVRALNRLLERWALEIAGRRHHHH